MFNINDRMAGVLEESFDDLMRELRAIRRELEQINARLGPEERPRPVRAVPGGPGGRTTTKRRASP